MSDRSSRALALIAAAIALLALAAAPAVAGPPGEDDNWTYLHSDPYKHWACKQKQANGDRWKVKTATLGRKDGIQEGIGVYAVIARGSNDNRVRERTSKDWNDSWIYLSFRGVEASDRLWIQAAAYGPAEPWSDGRRVGGLKRCTDIR
jgi:hypothetical protein